MLVVRLEEGGQGKEGRMRVLAIDPGQDLGWATDATGRLEWGAENFHVRNGESSGNRWRRFGEWLLSATCGYGPPSDEWPYSEAKTRPPKIDLVVYELKTFTPKGRAHAGELYGAFKSRLEEHCERHGIALQPVPVATLKAFAIPKDGTRKKGDPPTDRSKKAVQWAAALRLCKEFPWFADNVYGRDDRPGITDDEADALWLYWWAKENCKEAGR